MCDYWYTAKGLAVVAVVVIMMTGREVDIKSGVPAIETAAERGDDKYITPP